MQYISQLFSKTAGVAVTFGRDESQTDVTNFAQAKNLSLVNMQQEHAGAFAIVDNKQQQIYEHVDALITKTPGVFLTVKAADCLPILCYHPSGVIAVIHAGRAGTTKQITRRTLVALKEQFGISENLKIWFGPRICTECYQIDKKTNKHYDLVAENRKQVEAVFSDLQAEIVTSEYCTACDNDQWYSYRTEGKGVPMNWFGVGLFT